MRGAHGRAWHKHRKPAQVNFSQKSLTELHKVNNLRVQFFPVPWGEKFVFMIAYGAVITTDRLAGAAGRKAAHQIIKSSSASN